MITLLDCAVQLGKWLEPLLIYRQAVQRPLHQLNFQYFTVTKIKIGSKVYRYYNCAAHLTGRSPENLATGLFLYLGGNAAGYMRTSLRLDKMSFDELASALVKRFASGATNWHLRQTLVQRVQLENESVADYAESLRKLCARLSLSRTEWMHKFVFSLKKEIREYIILQQPDD